MKKPEVPPSKSGNRKQSGNGSRADTVLRELNDFLDHPLSAEILLGEWLYDSSLPIPSAGLLDFFATELLCASGKLTRFIHAETADANDTIKQLVSELKSAPSARVREEVDGAFALLRIVSFSVVSKGGAGANSLGWWLALWSFWGYSGEEQMFPEGERRLAQTMLHSMMLRAVFFHDVTRLEGLAEAVRVSKHQSGFKPPQAHLIALRMLRWMPYLTEKLGSPPQKSEMRYFLLEMYPGLSDSPKEWSAAAKIIRFQRSERGKRANTNLLLKIVAQAKKNGPSVKRKPSLRVPPHQMGGDDLPK
ncbi:MAG: hypothetical protein NTW21_33540 [Verrucomicrobia bacterium]|nr:hypothetical protein [Verrucomicrobiota bacterium]